MGRTLGLVGCNLNSSVAHRRSSRLARRHELNAVTVKTKNANKSAHGRHEDGRKKEDNTER